MSVTEIIRTLTFTQKAAYALICEAGVFRAEGPKVKTYRSLARIGLIKHNVNSDHRHEYVLSGEPPKRPMKIILRSVKEVVKSIVDAPDVKNASTFMHKPVMWAQAPPPAQYSNTTREQHIEKWMAAPVTTTGKEMVKVKCLTEGQMKYIIENYPLKTAEELAQQARADIMNVRLFCQANAIELVPMNGRTKNSYYTIPDSRKHRMKKVGYNGPQKKTA